MGRKITYLTNKKSVISVGFGMVKMVIFIACIALNFTKSYAQTVNGYAKVTGLSGASINVSNITGPDSFDVGDIVMIIQMQDDVLGVNTTNNSSFGTISSIGSAGNYEFLTISAVSGGTITFTSSPTKTYSTGINSNVQIVTLRRYGAPDYSTTSAMSALAWNGDIGGVIAIEVLGTLTLNNSINANYTGFRGGARSTNIISPCVSTATPSFAMANSSKFGFKGEGIYKNSNTTISTAQAKIANGGGGALTSNGGGGGGSNFATGGAGGMGYQCTAANTGSGFGGQSLSPYYSMNRIFMGGGGGGGQMNDLVGTNGGNGGGIVYVKANKIATPAACATAISITALGQTPPLAGNDGAGGGGAAGTVIVDAILYDLSPACPITFAANGGNGGTVSHGAVHGAGGAGGQGAVVFVTNPPTTNFIATTLNGTAGCNNNTVPCNSLAGSSPTTNNTGIFSFTPLGVTFVDFKAELMDRNARLIWSTASEINSDYFSIERSIDGLNFDVVGTVSAAGTSQTLLEYEFIDFNAFSTNDHFYYRIKEVDFDGKPMYTDLRFLQRNQLQTNDIVVFPNPFSDILNVYLPKDFDLENTVILLMDELGRLINSYPVNSQITSFTVSDLPKGLYIIHVSVDGKIVETEKVVK
jgi:hypothetical protein